MSNNNFEELNGKERSSTAIKAQMNAPNKEEAMHVSENVERAKNAANHAASVAKTTGSGQPATAIDQLKIDASRTTEDAVAEGKRDVQQAKTIGTGYVEQASSVANIALETAQNYLPAALGGKPVELISTTQDAPNLIDQVKNTAADLYATAVSTAQPPIDKLRGTASVVTDAAQPHAESARTTSDAACSQIETAKSAAKPHLHNAKQSARAVVDSALPGIENAKALKVQGSMGVVEGLGNVGQKSDSPSG